MIRPLDSVWEWAPLVMSGGRIYGFNLLNVTECEATSRIRRICHVGAILEGMEIAYWEFEFRFYDKFLQTRHMIWDMRALLDFARSRIENYFQGHRVPRPVHTWGKPIIVDCR